MSEHDLVIRNGVIIDGTGASRQEGDVAVRDGVITDVGKVDGRGRREINADGRLVQPGFVDIHTHYDGQATWDSQLAPSSWHGVTTVVAGNCGVGFAPVRPSDRDRLVQLMEGVEDIPGTALHEGLPWTWESFEDYLDCLDRMPHDIDLAVQLPHAALRLYVMGERGASRQPATPDDISQMSDIARSAVEAGAIGFSSSRTIRHKSSLGEPTPTLDAEFDEMFGIAESIGGTGKGVLQLISDFTDFESEFNLAKEMGRRSGRPVSISVGQTKSKPDQWKRLLQAMSHAREEGISMTGQVGARPIGVLVSHLGTVNPFKACPSYQALKDLPFSERVNRLRAEDMKRRILEEYETAPDGSIDRFNWQNMFPLGDPPNYEPDPSTSIDHTSRQLGVAPAALAYDLMLQKDGTALIYMPIINFVDGNLDSVREQLTHEVSVPGLSDGGAHVGTICDVSFPTTLMVWWGRDRPKDRIPLETLVYKQSRATAMAVGLNDRGLLAPGYKADINVVDFDRLTLHSPHIVADLPAGGRRFLQKVTGIDHTFVSGVEVASNSESTGETPGTLLRGGRAAP